MGDTAADSRQGSESADSPLGASGGRRGIRPQSRRSFLVTSGSIATLSLAGCISSGRSSDLTEVSYRHRFDRTGLVSAIGEAGVQLGAWESEGLEVDYRLSSGSDATAQSVANGDDEFGNVEVAAALKLIEEGAPLTIIGQEAEPVDGVISLADSGITDWKDLEGAVIARFPWAVSGDLAKAAMRKSGADPEAAQWQNMDPGSQQVLLMEDKVDAVVAYYPQAAIRLRHEGYETNVLVSSEVLDHLGISLITREEIVAERPDLVSRFVRGWFRAHQRFVLDIDEVIEIHRQEVSKFDEDVERETLGPIYASHVPPTDVGLNQGMGRTLEGRVQNTLSVLEEVGMLDDTRDAESYYTNQFIEENRELAVETAQIYYRALEETYGIDPDDSDYL